MSRKADSGLTAYIPAYIVIKPPTTRNGFKNRLKNIMHHFANVNENNLTKNQSITGVYPMAAAEYSVRITVYNERIE
ncbi:hypothetical protein VME0621_00081 [Vibrio mediterranei]|uniref:hypothetical protein n=1 Tax=Vibrio TaxID=662 RepID=UPI0007F3ABAB|nr:MULTISPECIES: hypothetical protein [Vibrio]SBO07995.1 hypothetical protein VME0621_00081 [Vibrio mediterranei]